MDPGGDHGDPQREADDEVRDAVAHACPPHDQHHEEEREGDRERLHRDVLREREGNDRERYDVVKDHEGEEEGPHTRRPPATDEREEAQREGRVGRHRDRPAPGGRLAGVEREVDERRRQHPSDGGEDRRRDPAPFPQLSHVELTADLEADDEEEERHESVVDPAAEIQRQVVGPQADREDGAP